MYPLLYLPQHSTPQEPLKVGMTQLALATAASLDRFGGTFQEVPVTYDMEMRGGNQDGRSTVSISQVGTN